MAIDRVLADRAASDGTIVYRLYRWERDSVSFGANEAATRTWDRERLERLKVPCVRRPTGGRGVWHDAADLTYSVTAPLTEFGDLRAAYRDIHEQLARALGRLDLQATVAPNLRRPTLAPGACFDLTVGGEVLVGERKTIGSAQALIGGGTGAFDRPARQRRGKCGQTDPSPHRPALLQHGAIARADRGPALARFRLESAAANHDISTEDLPAPDLLGNVIAATWLDEGAGLAPAELVDWAIRESAIHIGRYQDPDWTWRR